MTKQVGEKVSEICASYLGFTKTAEKMRDELLSILSHSLQSEYERGIMGGLTKEEQALIVKDLNGLLDVDKMMRKVTIATANPDPRFVAMMEQDAREGKLREQIVDKLSQPNIEEEGV